MPNTPNTPNTPEYAHSRVPNDKLMGGGHFAASYGAEHVAGGEFVVGAAFATWGASPSAVLGGLLIGNALAVLSWAWVCAPVAVKARLTLYEYLARMMGDGFVRTFNLLSGLIFAVIAGGMLTIAAQAVQGLFDTTRQVLWYPTSVGFVVWVAVFGVMAVWLTLKGFLGLTRFAKYVSPYLLTVFLVCIVASVPFLWQAGQAQGIRFIDIFSHYIWTGQVAYGGHDKEPFGIWHIAVFAWGLNLPLHLGMGDMSTLRFAKKWQYGYYSVFATFGGHFVAWIGAGMLGVVSAMLVGSQVGKLDIGGVVVPMLGVAGVLAVVFASLTTAVPSLYRAGLAFDGVFGDFGFRRAVIWVGVVITVVATFPLIFLKWLDLMAYFNIIMAPVGAMIACEHFILPHLGIRPFWQTTGNKTAVVSWAMGVILALGLVMGGVHLFFVFVPVWAVCFIVYGVGAWLENAHHRLPLSAQTLYQMSYGADDGVDNDLCSTTQMTKHPDKTLWLRVLILFMMVLWCMVLYVGVAHHQLLIFQQGLFVLTVLYLCVAGWQLRLATP
ncbi:hypothetical protein LU293_05845 [Moraxella nasovis]|uniref:hypothetical protein n=1 Tax=Moraxella nasovis TaxID=2904121 RepID=UPI001F61A63E|nr:hypothetical protein [Moraxella nasovis]UNU72640.1 hypothetical protein LU293_05845 [Moraxella nasovis]